MSIPRISRVYLKDQSKIFYREAGSTSNPTLLLLHGYPTSSLMFRNIIPLLSSTYHIIAPDLPGFGFTESTIRDYTFANLTKSIEEFIEILGLSKFAIYIFDYGAPVGLRLLLNDPSRITGIISQNGNAYEEGLDPQFWGPITEYWKVDKDDPTFVKALSEFVKDRNNTVDQYTKGFYNPDSVDLANAYLDYYFLVSKPNQTEIQLSLFHDYQSNIPLYPTFHKIFRENPDLPVLLVWGANDYIFNFQGAEAYKRDVKDLTIRGYETGHFALETHGEEISDEIVKFKKKLRI